jgi:hypothetical protein
MIGTQHLVEHGCVNRTEIKARLEAVVVIEIGPRGGLPVDTAGDRWADKHRGVGGAVVGTGAVVRGGLPAEFRDDKHRRSIGESRFEPGVERTQTGIEFAEKFVVLGQLTPVGVVRVLADADHAHTEVGIDESRCQGHIARHVPVGQLAGKDGGDVTADVERVALYSRDRVTPRAKTRWCVGQRSECTVETEVWRIRGAPQFHAPRRDTGPGSHLPGEMEWHVHTDVHHVQWAGIGGTVEPPAEPSTERPAVGLAAHPRSHRVEMAEARVGVPNSVDEGDMSLVIQGLQVGELRVEAETLADAKRRVGGYGQAFSFLVVRAVGNRHDGVHTVVATT